jgi:hypothetical protein
MVDILHKVGIKSSSQNDVYQALTTIDGLCGWWTADTQGDTRVGGVLKFRFAAGGFDMKVLELHPAAGRLDHRALQAPRVGRAGGVHASLQHQVGCLSVEPQVVAGNRQGRTSSS